MKIAQQLAALTVIEAQKKAEEDAIDIGQIWGGDGYTKYTFDDNSVLIQSGTRQYALDADSAESIREYKKWLGADAHLEAEEVKQIIAALRDRNLSAVARATGLTLSTLWRLKNGQTKPTLGTRKILEDYFSKQP